MKKLLFLLLINSCIFAQTVTRTATVEITRPANATAYAALDAVSNSSTAPTVLSFKDLGASGSGQAQGVVIGALLRTDQSTNTARFKLHLYSSSVTAINDNDAYTSLYANNSTSIGSISFDACSTEGSGGTSAVSLNTTIRLPFTLPTGTYIYGLLETLDAFTPASGQKIFIRLTTMSDSN